MNKIDADAIFETIVKLMGEVAPTGHHEIDMERCNTIDEYKRLIILLLEYLGDNLKYSDRQEKSIKDTVRSTRFSFDEILEEINNILELMKG